MFFYVPAAEDMVKLGSALGELLGPGSLVSLVGDLGAGKTTFVKGMAAGLGISAHITSPTFTLIKEYQGRVPFYHIDVYRLDAPEELAELGFDELTLRDGVIAVEWGDEVEGILPEAYILVEISREKEEARAVTITARGKSNEDIIGELEKDAVVGPGERDRCC